MRVHTNRPSEPESTVDGYVLTDAGDKLVTHAVGVLFGAVFAGAGMFMLLVNGPLLAKFMSVPFLAVGLIIVGVTGRSMWRIRRFDPGTLTSPVWPITRGDRNRMTYRRSVKRGQPAAPQAVDARLVLTEVARYRRGTDTHTVTEEVASFPVKSHVLSTPGALAVELDVTVPANLPPSFHASNNRIEWWIEVQPVPGDDAIDGSSFKVTVAS